MTFRRSLRLAGLGSLGVLGSCSTEARSCDLSASAIVLHATVTDGDDGVEVELELETSVDESESVGTSLTLCEESGERLEVNGRAAEQVRVLGHVYYVVEFDAPESTYSFEYVRDDGTITAELAMPPTFEILTPAEDTEIARSAPLEITWDPTWPEHVVLVAIEDRIGSDCLEGLGYSTEVEDVGGTVIVANQLEAGPSATANETCKAWIALTRSSVAAYPEALHEGGSIEGVVKRRRRFLSSG